MTVVETPSFLRRAKGLLSETERADLVAYLAEHPDSGKVMEGTGGVRKLRWAREGEGKSGGYRLNRKPEEYTAREILEVTEGGLVPVNCACLTKDEERKRSGLCPSLPVWQKLDKLIYDYLDSVSLSDLISKE